MIEESSDLIVLQKKKMRKGVNVTVYQHWTSDDQILNTHTHTLLNSVVLWHPPHQHPHYNSVTVCPSQAGSRNVWDYIHGCAPISIIGYRNKWERFEVHFLVISGDLLPFKLIQTWNLSKSRLQVLSRTPRGHVFV